MCGTLGTEGGVPCRAHIETPGTKIDPNRGIIAKITVSYGDWKLTEEIETIPRDTEDLRTTILYTIKTYVDMPLQIPPVDHATSEAVRKEIGEYWVQKHNEIPQGVRNIFKKLDPFNLDKGVWAVL